MVAPARLMNRLLTPLLLLLALLALAAAITLRSCVSRPTGDLIFACDPGRVKAVRLRAGGDVLEVRRKDGSWQVVAPDFRDQAGREAVERLILAACQPAFSHRVPASEAAESKAEFGLRSPKRWIEVEEARKWRLLIGKESAIEGLVYARLEGSDDVFLIPKSYAELCEIPPAKLRFPKVSPIGPADVERLIVRAGAGEMEMARSPAGWEFIRPLAARADDRAVEELLGEILGAPVLGFEGKDSGDLGHLGIEPGQKEFAVYAAGRERPSVIRFGKEVPGEAGQVFAQLTARDAVVRLPATIKERALAAHEELRDRRLLPVNPDLVDAIEISRPGSSVELRRAGDGWQVAGSGLPADGGLVGALFEALSSARIIEFVRETPARPPDASVRFVSILSENTPEANAGTQEIASARFWAEGGALLVKVSGQSGAVSTAPGLLELLDPSPETWLIKSPGSPPAEKSLGENPEGS
ncbi:MAG: DUF4340 domain-containing protein, partial [Terrimicrobiaceae bacterium]|nr:DUF4340 domain-containing protein [Terrimicrobiaceae bacterium]